jgi:hypothetical protein
VFKDLIKMKGDQMRAEIVYQSETKRNEGEYKGCHVARLEKKVKLSGGQQSKSERLSGGWDA